MIPKSICMVLIGLTYVFTVLSPLYATPNNGGARIKITLSNQNNFYSLPGFLPSYVRCYYVGGDSSTVLSGETSRVKIHGVTVTTWSSFKTLIYRVQHDSRLSSKNRRLTVASLKRTRHRAIPACKLRIQSLVGTPTPTATPDFSAALQVSNATIDFNSVQLDTTSPALSFELSNNADIDLKLNGAQFEGEGSSDYLLSADLPQNIAAKSSQKVSVKFSPQALGNRPGILRFTASSNLASTSVTLSGTGVENTELIPVSFLETTAIDFSVGNKFSRPTQLAFGPDGRLYVASTGGELAIYTLDDNYQVVATSVVRTLSTLINRNSLGIGFNPMDPPTPVRVYLTHSGLFFNNSGGECATNKVPYTGQVSVLTGPQFEQLTPIVTGLPVSNDDDGINGIEFDNKGDLYIGVDSTTDAGVADCAMGGISDSPLSASIVKAQISLPNFNGAAVYRNRNTQVISDDERDSDSHDLLPGSNLSVFAAGLRNAFDLVLSTHGEFYATDNGPGQNFGPASTSATTQGPPPTAPDELLLLQAGNYYGSPNRNRGRSDDRQNVYHPPSDAEIPGVYTAPLAILQSSSNGITEYRSATFHSAIRGDLLIKRFSFSGAGDLYDVKLGPDGKSVASINVLNNQFSGVDVTTGPGGAVLITDLRYDNSIGSKIRILLPDDHSTVAMRAFDISPWRGPSSGGTPFVIGGKGFSSDAKVYIGGVRAEVTSVRPTRIQGIVPSTTSAGNSMVDVRVTSEGAQSIIRGAYRYL